MLDTIRRLFADNVQPATPDHRLRIAIAALLHHVVAVDGVVTPAEEAKLRSALQTRYGLDEPMTRHLMAEGRAADLEAIDLHRFTSVVKAGLDIEERKPIVGLLWDMAYADGARDTFEDNILWRISELLGVSTADRVALRQNAAKHTAPLHDSDDSTQ